MKGVRDLLVTQVRLYPVNSLPLDVVTSPSVLGAMHEAFNFQSVESGVQAPPGSGVPPTVSLVSGEFVDQGKPVVIRGLEIQARRILARISGDSDQANEFHKLFVKTLNEASPNINQNLEQPIYTAEDTSCLANLDFDFEQLYRPSVADFLSQRVTNEASKPNIPARVFAQKFAARVIYDVQDPIIKEYGISVNAKDFVIEPNPNTPLRERIYFTRSPFPTKTHFKLLEEFEAIFK